MTINCDVLIVGAGATGLASACKLSANGLSVVVVEARNRVGGRILTKHEAGGSAVELGAEFIHGKPDEIFDIIHEAGIKTEEVHGTHWYFENGKLSKSNDFFGEIDPIMEGLENEPVDRSFKSYLDSLPDNEETVRAKHSAARYVEGFHAAETNRIGVFALRAVNEGTEKVEGERAFRMPGGYSQLPLWLRSKAEQAGTKFHLETIVEEIDWSPGQCRVKCRSASGETEFKARHVVITVPLSLLQSAPDNNGAISFHPPLPAQTITAINSLAMGSVLHVVVAFKKSFWQDMDFTRIGHEGKLKRLGFIHYPGLQLPTWWATAPHESSSLVGWCGGPPARQLPGTEQEIMPIVTNSLARIFGVNEEFIRDQVSALTFHDWRADSFTRGGYTCVPVNAANAQSELAKPIDKSIFFAGEALSVEHVGTVHGAMRSGTNAAKLLLDLMT